MKQIYKSAFLLFLTMAATFTHLNTLSQPQPLFVRLKGVGTGSAVTGMGTGIQLAGNIAYVFHAGGLEIYSVTNPVAPVRIGGRATELPANAGALAGRLAFLALGAKQTLTNDSGAFEIVDVGDPFNPVRVGYANTLARANDIRIAGNYAYVAECTRWTGSNLIGALEIFDISTHTNPFRVACFDTSGCATSTDVSDHHAYLADGVTDLQVLDVADPGNPRRVGLYQPDLSRCAFEALGRATYVHVVGNLAYSGGGDGLRVLDVTDPSLPVFISDNGCVTIYSLHVAGQYAYSTIWNSSFNTFQLVIADSTHLVNVAYKVHWPTAPMQVVKNLIYVAGNPLLVYEITDQPAIRSISHSEGYLTLTWDSAPGFVLQRTSSLADPLWSEVPDSSDRGSIELPMTQGNEFFRLARP